MDGVDYSGICDLAREQVMEKIKSMAQDRMTQGEALNDAGFLAWLEKDDKHDDEVFGAYESYLNYIHHIVQNALIPLHV